MKRRKFIQRSVLTGASTLALGGLGFASASAAEMGGSQKLFNLNYAPHAGMFKNHAGGNFIDQIKFIHDQGFRSIEDNGMTGRSVSEQTEVGETLVKLRMDMGVFVLNKGRNGANTLVAGKQEYVDIFLKGCHQAVEVAKRVNAK